MTDRQFVPDAVDCEISLLDILVVLAESWRLLVLGPLFAGLLAGALSFLLPKTFVSTSIVRLSEEDVACLHAAPVLDPLIEKYGYLDRAEGDKDDARKSLIQDLPFSIDKKTKLVTIQARGRTPESAQMLGKAALNALLECLQPRGKEKEAILQEVAINNQLIADGVLLIPRRSSKEDVTKGISREQIASLKLNNLELALKLQPRGPEVFVQEPSLPRRKTAPNRGQLVLVVVLISGFVLLLFVFVRKAWQAASLDPVSAGKVTRIRQLFGLDKI